MPDRHGTAHERIGPLVARRREWSGTHDRHRDGAVSLLPLMRPCLRGALEVWTMQHIHAMRHPRARRAVRAALAALAALVLVPLAACGEGGSQASSSPSAVRPATPRSSPSTSTAAKP